MELLHAYPNAKLARANGVVYSTPGQLIPGTRIQFSLPSATWSLIADVTNGFNLTFNRETMTLNIDDCVDPARTESYWITTGWKWTSRSASGVSNVSVMLGTTQIASPSQIFALAGGVVGAQVAYTELAYNPITKEIRVYVNGNRFPGTFTHDGSSQTVRLAQVTPVAAPVYLGDIYVARFEGNEEPRLRRWKMETLAPVTNGIGANIDKVDGQVASVQGTELVATYNIPANAMAIAVDVSGESVNNASDITTRITDGTTTSNKRNTGFNGPLNTVATGSPVDFRGNALIAGTVKPAANATTLTVGVKALDRT